ncbi:hypothetical protein E2C01_003893 [Portunus trituberculatus]|uniref:Bactericidal permeability-increasing protein n=1 Tax=Portunus trituberculatus TaxID=210409 RepID=A0A5B7CP27_PORTR|nr:hypothetical protein [Portunus trituberculatus]
MNQRYYATRVPVRGMWRPHASPRYVQLFPASRRQAKGKLSLPYFNLHGGYKWPGPWSNSEGYANITMIGIEMTLDLFFGINDVGLLSVEPKMDLEFEDLKLNFTGLTYAHSFAVSAAKTFFSTGIQPIIFSKVQTKVKSLVNQRIEERLQNITFPDSISPVDFAMVKLSIAQEDRLQKDKAEDVEGIEGKAENEVVEGQGKIEGKAE